MKICPNCKSNKVKKYNFVNLWKINKCYSCDILFTEYVRSKIKREFYNSNYVKGYKSRELILNERFRHHLKKIEKYKAGGKMLDIGCGLGFFLKIAKESKAYHWQISGIELNSDLIKYADPVVRKNIVRGTIEQIPFKDNSFDCAVCFDVLEHSYNLQKNVMEIRRVLKKDGIFVLQAPNYQSLMTFLTGSNWDWWAPPDHLLHFSYDFLVKLLRKNGFIILESFTYEATKDFLSNIQGKMGRKILLKLLFKISTPLLVVIEHIGWVFQLGGLSFIVAQKK